jgi:hypothetical protein
MPITPIDKQAFGEGGCVISTNAVPTASPQYEFCAMQCVTDVTVSVALSTPLMTGTQTVTYPAGFVLFTPITGGTGTITGTAIFYKAL